MGGSGGRDLPWSTPSMPLLGLPHLLPCRQHSGSLIKSPITNLQSLPQSPISNHLAHLREIPAAAGTI